MGKRLRRNGVLAGAMLAAALIAGCGGEDDAALGPGEQAGPEIGADTDTTWGVPPDTAPKTLTLSKAAGVTWAREGVGWNLAQPTPTQQLNEQWVAAMDDVVKDDLEAGINPILLIDQPPYWASGDPNKHVDSAGRQVYNHYYKPANFQDYANFVGWVVERYSSMGVKAYEIWNEANIDQFWPSGPNAAEYMQMLSAAYDAAHQADPNAIVVSTGLAPAGNMFSFLRGMYANGLSNKSDQVGLHEYPLQDPEICWSDDGVDNSPRAFCSIASVDKIMGENGDTDKKVWITEMGWGTCQNSGLPAWQNCVSEERQAKNLSKAYELMESEYPVVSVANWWSFRDVTPDPADWVSNFGLVRRDFSAKPAYNALKAFSEGVRTQADEKTRQVPPPQGGTPGFPPNPPNPSAPKKRKKKKRKK